MGAEQDLPKNSQGSLQITVLVHAIFDNSFKKTKFKSYIFCDFTQIQVSVIAYSPMTRNRRFWTVNQSS